MNLEFKDFYAYWPVCFENSPPLIRGSELHFNPCRCRLSQIAQNLRGPFLGAIQKLRQAVFKNLTPPLIKLSTVFFRPQPLRNAKRNAPLENLLKFIIHYLTNLTSFCVYCTLAKVFSWLSWQANNLVLIYSIKSSYNAIKKM